MTANPMVRNGHLVESLERSLRSGKHGLAVVPNLLKTVLSEGSWREFTTQRDEVVHYERFADFVTTPPLKGLGATVELIKRVIGDDPEALDLLDRALQNHVGRPETGGKHSNNPSRRDRSGQHVRRLRKDFPELHADVLAGRVTVRAAAIKAGIYPRRASVSLNDAKSAANTLNSQATPEFLAELRRLLDG